MQWSTDLLVLAKWALMIEDLRHRMLTATSAVRILKTPGISNAYEQVVALRVFEAALAHGYRNHKTVVYEVPYPGAAGGKNPKRADLAFKEGGKGQGWNYVEVKWYSADAISKDMAKLCGIAGKTTRWMLVYRVVGAGDDGPGAKISSLSKLMAKRASDAQVRIVRDAEDLFTTPVSADLDGSCQVWLGQIAKL